MDSSVEVFWGQVGISPFTMVSTIFDEKDPWSGVLQRCGSYNRTTLAGTYGGSMRSCTRADGTMARAEIT